MSSQSPLNAVVVGSIVLAGAAAFWMYQSTTTETPIPAVETVSATVPSNSAAVNNPDLPKTPSHEAALQTLFNLSNSAEQAKTADDTLTSFWFEQTLKVGDKIVHAEFFKSQQLDESGELIDSHGTPVSVAVMTYQLQDKQWQTASKQISFTDAGAWGDVPDTDISTLQLSPKVSAILINFSDSMGGYTEEGKTLYAYTEQGWLDLGYLSTGADNAGACDDSPTPSGEAGLGACWSYQGTITPQPGNNADYPDLLVTRSGTDSDDAHTGTRPASNVLYRFDGKKYVEATSK